MNCLPTHLPNSILTSSLPHVIADGNFLKEADYSCSEFFSSSLFLDSEASSLFYLDTRQLTLGRCLSNGWASLGSPTFFLICPFTAFPPPSCPLQLCVLLQMCCSHSCLCALGRARHSSPWGTVLELCVLVLSSLAALTTLIAEVCPCAPSCEAPGGCGTVSFMWLHPQFPAQCLRVYVPHQARKERLLN